VKGKYALLYSRYEPVLKSFIYEFQSKSNTLCIRNQVTETDKKRSVNRIFSFMKHQYFLISVFLNLDLI
jgi:hypothetical protein